MNEDKLREDIRIKIRNVETSWDTFKKHKKIKGSSKRIL